MVDLVKIFLTFSLITMQNLVVVCARMIAIGSVTDPQKHAQVYPTCVIALYLVVLGHRGVDSGPKNLGTRLIP